MKQTVLIFSLLIAFCIPAKAETFDIPDGDITALVNAITTANTNGEADIINLAENGTYTFTSAYEDVFTNSGSVFQGKIALPQIRNDDTPWDVPNTLDLTINGNGATFIRSSSEEFRFIYTHLYTVVEINGITFRNGLGKHRGGAIFSGWRTQLKVDDCKFYENKTKDNQDTFDQGGGAIMIAAESSLEITNSYFEANEANDYPSSLGGNGGGAVMCLLSDFVLESCTFHKNKSSNNGGAVYTDGALKDNGTFNIRSCIFTENTSVNGSGALLNYMYNQNVSVIENCHFEQNFCSTGHGGAIYSGAGAITHSGYTNTGNQTQVIIQNCSIINNSSGENTGGLFMNEHHSTVINCTIAENDAPNLSAGLFIGTNRLSFSMESLTIANNTSSGTAPAIFLADGNKGNATMKNCIIANNQHLALNSGSKDLWTVQGNNLQYPNDDFGSGITVADPLLQAPALNDAVITYTMATAEGSPVIDAGIDYTERDQRYALRVGTGDIGAYEFGGVPEKSGNPPITPPSQEVINIKAFNLLTPNGDGRNDTWQIENLSGDYQIRVFTKNGQIVYETDNYNQDWNGVDKNGNPLPAGVYYYSITVSGEKKAKTGYITIVN